MGIYDEMRDVTAEVMRDFDQSRGTGERNDGLWYIDMVPGTGPADDPGPSTEKPYKLDGAARGVSFKYKNDAGILTTDLQLSCAARDDMTPKATGFIDMDGVRHKIVRIDNVPPVGVTVAHRIFFRK